MTAAVKALTLRLPQWLTDDVATVAMVDGQPMAETIRLAVTAYIARRVEAPDWALKVALVTDRMNQLTEELT